MNNSPIEFFSKGQNTVETSTFGSELVAGCIAMEKVKAYRTKLRLLGVPVEAKSYMLCVFLSQKRVGFSASKLRRC